MFGSCSPENRWMFTLLATGVKTVICKWHSLSSEIPGSSVISKRSKKSWFVIDAHVGRAELYAPFPKR